ncbi:hypothetical protein, partial [Komagataeibacter sp. FXV3]|uniref:hypothetical protein n=1 Tax=Komagataeibacter sp. FXV3 TaxID=2608998 RepID=UPI001D10D489
SWKAPSDRLSDFFLAVARIASNDFTRSNFIHPVSPVLPQTWHYTLSCGAEPTDKIAKRKRWRRDAAIRAGAASFPPFPYRIRHGVENPRDGGQATDPV